MSNINTEGLPPEMQARIADIIEKAKTSAIQPAVNKHLCTTAPPAPARTSTFTDGSRHCTSSRSELHFGKKYTLQLK